MPSLRFAAAACAFLSAASSASTSSISEPSARLMKIHYTPKDQQTARYANVPFDVPAGTTRIDIELGYDKAGGENVVDLGLLEPGPLALGTRAFRGWTGGERSAIFVSASDATPGYWPGPIQPGTWHVGLGLYKVGAKGVDVEVTVKTSSDAIPMTPPPLPERAKEPIKIGPAWYAGALHTHTHNSDGALSVQALAEKARAAGLDFLAITDHNNTAHQREKFDVPGLLHIIGEEVTTPGGHMNVWGLGGLRDFIDFRVLPGDAAIATVVNTAMARGALVGINHPYSACVACSWTHSVPQGVSTIEISGREPEEMLRAVALWDTLLRQGRPVTALGVSDWHRGDAPIGSASVRVFAPELSTKAILAAIRAGRVVVMMDGTSQAPQAELSTGNATDTTGAGATAIGGTARVLPGDKYQYRLSATGDIYQGASAELYWNGERVAAAPLVDGRIQFERFASTDGYLRATVLSASGAPIAVINPIWIKTSER